MKLPAICQKPPKTTAGAMRQYHACFRAYKKAFNGGGTFGWDWPTMRSNAPECYAKMKALIETMRQFKAREATAV